MFYDLSQLRLTLEPTIFNLLAPIVELSDERSPSDINIRTINIHVDNQQGNVSPLAVDSDVIHQNFVL